MELPQEFIRQMMEELKEEGADFLRAYEEEPIRGLRLSSRRLKAFCGGDAARQGEILSRLSIGDTVNWCAKGRYIDGSQPTKEQSAKEQPEKEKTATEKADRGPGSDPLHFAGLYYIQEPSAMLPAALLGACPGERVLDLCAAPGGKSTQLIDDMDGEGLLVSNDISASRGRAIVKNLERFGAGQILVTAESPENLAAVFPDFFDRILVDAPCSGEGMFRREPSMREEWRGKGPDYYVPLQRAILREAVKMLRPGGRLVYSTCTFNRQEDEENAAWLLQEYGQLRLLQEEKLMPHRKRGEGQYAALFERAGEAEEDAKEYRPGKGLKKGEGFLSYQALGRKEKESCEAFFALTGQEFHRGRWQVRDGQLYELPALLPSLPRLRYLRTGLLLGEFKNGRFEPSQALAMYLDGSRFANVVDFSPEDGRTWRYLRGETVDAEGAVRRGGDGWCLVLCGGLSLGFAKRSADRLKNKYAPGCRMQ